MGKIEKIESGIDSLAIAQSVEILEYSEGRHHNCEDAKELFDFIEDDIKPQLLRILAIHYDSITAMEAVLKATKYVEERGLLFLYKERLMILTLLRQLGVKVERETKDVIS